MTKKEKIIQECVETYVRNAEFATNAPVSEFVKSKMRATYSTYKIKDIETAIVKMNNEYCRERQRREEAQYWASEEGQEEIKSLHEEIKSLQEAIAQAESTKIGIFGTTTELINCVLDKLSKNVFRVKHFIKHENENAQHLIEIIQLVRDEDPEVCHEFGGFQIECDTHNKKLSMRLNNCGWFEFFEPNMHAERYIVTGKFIEYVHEHPMFATEISNSFMTITEIDKNIQDYKDKIRAIEIEIGK